MPWRLGGLPWVPPSVCPWRCTRLDLRHSITERAKGAHSLALPAARVSLAPKERRPAHSLAGGGHSLTQFDSGEGFFMSESEPQTLPCPSVRVCRHHLPAPPGDSPPFWGCLGRWLQHGLREARDLSGPFLPLSDPLPALRRGSGLPGAKAAQ